jgi:hypothetical protein
MLGIGRASVYRVLSRGNWCPDLRLASNANGIPTRRPSARKTWKCAAGRLRKATTTPPPSMTRYAALSHAIGLTCWRSFRLEGMRRMGLISELHHSRKIPIGGRFSAYEMTDRSYVISSAAEGWVGNLVVLVIWFVPQARSLPRPWCVVSAANSAGPS